MPLEILLSAGNENERRYLLPLLDLLAKRKIRPVELHGDRGYYSLRHEQALSERGIRSRISRPRRKGEPIPAGTKTREVWRGKNDGSPHATRKHANAGRSNAPTRG